MVKLMLRSDFIITDSGGIQEETTVLAVPCITLRENTERPVTLEAGGNLLLLSRMTSQFIGGDLQTYMGIDWAETDAAGRTASSRARMSRGSPS